MYEGDGCIVSRHEIAVPKRVYVITGRIGDIHMVCEELKEPSIIACQPKYKGIVDELFPWHEVFEVVSDTKDLQKVVGICAHTFPRNRIILCQQDGNDPNITRKFRSFQSQQEYIAANVL